MQDKVCNCWVETFLDVVCFLQSMEKLSHKLVEYGRQVREGILGGSWKCLGMSQSILRWDAWKSLGMLGSVLGGFGQIFIVKNYVFENKKV